MQYEELRATLKAHFTELLSQRRKRIAEAGPLDAHEIQTFETSAALGEDAVQTGEAFLMFEDEEAKVLHRFITKYGLAVKPGTKPYNDLRRMMPAAYRDYARAVLKHNASLGNFDFDQIDEPNPSPNQLQDTVVNLGSLISLYFNEAEKGGQWAGKTSFEKSDHLNLLK